jgi:hypothetical protein
MSENQACWSQVHLTAFWCLRVKLKKRVLNRWLKPILQGGRPGSHPTPNQMIGKRTVNTTLTKGHQAQTPLTARNFFFFSHDSSTPIHYTLSFLTGEDDYRQDRFLAIRWVHWHQREGMGLASFSTGQSSYNTRLEWTGFHIHVTKATISSNGLMLNE